jgi:hypothetical protein
MHRLVPRLGLRTLRRETLTILRFALSWLCVCCAALVASACATQFDGSLLRKHDVAYRIGPLDSNFRRVHVEDNDLAFYSPGAGSIAVNALCEGYEDVPQQALLNHLLFGTTRRSYLIDEEVTLDGRAARHALVDAELDGVPVRLEIYVLRRARCVFDLSYVSDRAARAHPQFAQFVHAFRIVEVRLD